MNALPRTLTDSLTRPAFNPDRIALQPILNVAKSIYQKVTAASDCWGFTIAAVSWLVEWLYLMRPEATATFLKALAECAVARDRLQTEAAQAKRTAAEADLYAAIIAGRDGGQA